MTSNKGQVAGALGPVLGPGRRGRALAAALLTVVGIDGVRALVWWWVRTN